MRTGKRAVELCVSPSDVRNEEASLIYDELCEKCQELADSDKDEFAIFEVERYCPKCRKALEILAEKLNKRDEERGDFD